MKALERWLAELEMEGELDAAVLWPETRTDALQMRILEMQGASDWQMELPSSRPAQIVSWLEKRGAWTSVLDLCCGDGLVLWQIRRAFLRAECYGVDLARYPEHDLAERSGVRFYRVALQRLVESKPPEQISMVMMLNTFREWESAHLRPEEADLPAKVEQWLADNAAYAIVTATAEKVKALREAGWQVQDIGRGEQKSRMVAMWRLDGANV